MKNTASPFLSIISFALLLLCLPLVSSAQMVWFNEVLDSNVSDADEYDAAVTTITPGYMQIPWMSYVDGPYDGERFHLKVVWLSDADEWIISTVDTNTWGHASMVIEQEWTPHLCYRQGRLYEQGILRYATKDNFYNWVLETVDPEMGLQDPVIKLNPDDNPVIVYGCGQYPHQHLKMAEKIGANWDISIVDSSGRCEAISFVYDSQGIPHISYVLVSGGCFLKYAFWNGERWEFTVLAEISAGYSTSLDLDSHDNPHIAYHSGAEGICYTHKTGAEWQTEQVDDDNCCYARLDLNSSDEPCIAYYHADDGALMFATRISQHWLFQTVDDDLNPNIRIGRFPAIMVNSWADVCLSYYYHEAGQPCRLKYAAGHYQSLFVNLTPSNPPVIIPANGGSFEFNIEVQNPTWFIDTLNLWTNAVLLPGRDFGPFIDLEDLVFPPDFICARDRVQQVPANAPPGQYYYRVFLGENDSTITAMDFFLFTKLALDDGSPFISEWQNWGEEFREEPPHKILSPDYYKILTAFPNPFNPSTVLSFEMQDASCVKLVVYDIQGREVARLLDGFQTAGPHSITFDGSNLASGIYFAKLQAGEFKQTRKILLVK